MDAQRESWCPDRINMGLNCNSVPNAVMHCKPIVQRLPCPTACQTSLCTLLGSLEALLLHAAFVLGCDASHKGPCFCKFNARAPETPQGESAGGREDVFCTVHQHRLCLRPRNTQAGFRYERRGCVCPACAVSDSTSCVPRIREFEGRNALVRARRFAGVTVLCDLLESRVMRGRREGDQGVQGTGPRLCRVCQGPGLSLRSRNFRG